MVEGPIKRLSEGEWTPPKDYPARKNKAGRLFIGKTFPWRHFHWEDSKSDPRTTPDRRLQIVQGTGTAPLPQLLHDQICLQAQQKGLARESFPGRSTPLQCLRHQKRSLAVGKNERSKTLTRCGLERSQVTGASRRAEGNKHSDGKQNCDRTLEQED